MSLIPDGADRDVRLAKAERIQGWTVDEWIAFLDRHPDATLPAGVGGAIVSAYRSAIDGRGYPVPGALVGMASKE